MTIARRTLLIAIPIALLIILLAKTVDYAQRVSEHVRLETPVAEDNPNWDCRTMGNHICGPVPTTSISTATYDISIAELAMRQTCYGAIVWAEYNATQPGAYEVLADCPPA